MNPILAIAAPGVPRSKPGTMSAARKEQLRIGRGIAAQLEEILPLSVVAENLGLSVKRVRQIEHQALYKVAMRMQELRVLEENL